MPTRNTQDYQRPNPRIPTALYSQLCKIAEAERHSLNDQIIIAIEEYVRRYESAP